MGMTRLLRLGPVSNTCSWAAMKGEMSQDPVKGERLFRAVVLTKQITYVYCPGLNLMVITVWTETGRPFIVYGLNFHCLTPSMAVLAKAREPCRNLAS